MNILFDLGIILLATKVLGIWARKLGLPQVVGMVLAGLLIGPAIFGPLGIGNFSGVLTPTAAEMDVLQSFSQIGAVLILFSSGLETDFKELKKTGGAATLIATAGVFIPMALGTFLSLFFMGGLSKISDPDILHNALFVGAILSATSVGITVETLRELGKLNSKIGTTILSAAIIDDIIGILVLSLVTSLKGGGSIALTLLKAVGFFAVSGILGFIIRKLFRTLQARHPHARRTGIFALALCFIYAYIAEEFFGIAAITGGYVAGLMLSGLRDTAFVDRKVLVSGYMIFTPMFFAYIGISADFSAFRPEDLIFGLCFVFVGILGKILGCAPVANAFHFNTKDSLSIGCGMIARGEVALAVYTTGKILIAPQGGIDPLVATILLIVLSSICCPILLKLMFRNEHHPEVENKVYKPMNDDHQPQ